MFNRRRADRDRPAPKAAVGIGALVVVTSAPGDADAWVGEPVGVVVGSGANAVYGYPTLQTPRFWDVAFSQFEYMADGRGPFEHASIPEWRLEVVEPDDAG